VKNPHIRAKLTEVLFEMFPHEDRPSFIANRFFSIFETNETSLKFLIPALVQLYVDIETTGSK
jgi:hypothetical protein